MRVSAKPKFTLLIVLKFCLAIVLGWQTELKAVEPHQSSWQPAQGKWQPVAPHREDRGAIKVVWLQGTPYEMGYQHGKFLHTEIASLGPEVLEALRFAGKGLGISRLAMRHSFPEVVEECRGLVAATEDIGFTMDSCMVVAFGDVYQELFAHMLPNMLFRDGCSAFVVTGKATVDGRLYHGATYDNNKKPIDYWVKNPTVFVRQPLDGIPHVYISMPGAVWPDSGMNAAGITISVDAAHLQSIDQISLQGGSNVQVMAQVMNHAQSFQEARTLMGTWQRMRGNIIAITDGKSRQAGMFELTGREMAVRQLDENGIVYATNHFVAPGMAGKDEPPGQSSLSRYERYKQLLEPDGAYSVYGKLAPSMMVQILRDRTNPHTLKKSPLNVFDDDASIGGNGSLRQEVFDPEKLLFWVAGGKVPVPENPFVCFSLGEMLGLPNAERCESPAIK